jgi:hypothetical protein
MSEPLRIRFATDVESAKQGMASLAASVSANALQMGTSLQALNDNVARVNRAMSLLPSTRGGLLALTGTVLAIAAGAALMGQAVQQADDQLERFIKLGENAERAGVGVEFFQRFTEAAKEAKIEVAGIEAALKKAGDTVTPKFEQSDPIRGRLSDLFESGYLGNYQSQALARYRAAGNNEDRIRAAVDAMRELRNLGEGLAAIDLAERLFGTDVAERIRSGRLDLEAIAQSLDRQRDDLVKQEEVERAAEFKERLEEAYRTIDEALHVSLALAEAGRAINDIWLKIAEATAKAATVAGTYLDKMLEAARAAKEAQGTAGLQSPLAPKDAEEGQSLGATLGAVAGRGARGRTIYEGPAGPDLPKGLIENAPLPPRRPLDMVLNPEKYGVGVKPTGKKEADDSLSAVETYINGLERSTAALKAEMSAIGMGNVERQTAINLARAEAVAKQNNIKLSDEEIRRIRETSKASVEARDAIDDAREKQQRLRDLGAATLGGIADGFRSGQSAAEVFASTLDRIARKIEDLAFNGLLDAAFGKSGESGGGALTKAFSSLLKDFGGGFAGGGDLPAGKWALVGEKGPELIGAAAMARTIIPNGAGLVAPAASGGIAPPIQIIDQRRADSPLPEPSRGPRGNQRLLIRDMYNANQSEARRLGHLGAGHRSG